MNNIWQFLGLTQNTIGRGRYFVANIVVFIGLPIVIFLFSLLMTPVIGLIGDAGNTFYLLIILALVSTIFTLAVYIKTTIRRVRDIGINKHWWLFAIIPLVNILFFIFLCLKKGGSGNVHFSLRNNPFTEQFKRFFSHELSKPFIIVCFSVIVAGAVYAWFAASNLKQGIDTKIEQRGEELDKIYDAKDQENDIEYQARNEKYKECISEYKRERPWLNNSSYISPSLSGCGREPVNYQIFRLPYKYFEDASYKELNRIKNTSSFQLFFEKFGFGWWGIIALSAVFLINILIGLFKFSKRYLPLVVGAGAAQATLTKTNIRNMPAFQRYILLIALLILIALVLVLIKL